MADSDVIADLYSLIKTGWALIDADLNIIGNKKVTAGVDVHLSTGWYDGALQSPQVTVTGVSGVENFAAAGYLQYGERDLVDVGVWVQVQRDTGKGEGYAKAVLYKLQTEVKRILRGAHGGAGNIGHIDVGDWRFVPEPERDSPLLHWVLTVACQTFKTRSDS